MLSQAGVLIAPRSLQQCTAHTPTLHSHVHSCCKGLLISCCNMVHHMSCCMVVITSGLPGDVRVEQPGLWQAPAPGSARAETPGKRLARRSTKNACDRVAPAFACMASCCGLCADQISSSAAIASWQLLPAAPQLLLQHSSPARVTPGIPNACACCHGHGDSDWLWRQQLARWQHRLHRLLALQGVACLQIMIGLGPGRKHCSSHRIQRREMIMVSMVPGNMAPSSCPSTLVMRCTLQRPCRHVTLDLQTIHKQQQVHIFESSMPV